VSGGHSSCSTPFSTSTILQLKGLGDQPNGSHYLNRFVSLGYQVEESTKRGNSAPEQKISIPHPTMKYFSIQVGQQILIGCGELINDFITMSCCRSPVSHFSGADVPQGSVRGPFLFPEKWRPTRRRRRKSPLMINSYREITKYCGRTGFSVGLEDDGALAHNNLSLEFIIPPVGRFVGSKAINRARCKRRRLTWPITAGKKRRRHHRLHRPGRGADTPFIKSDGPPRIN
jgi:hypothetical protein